METLAGKVAVITGGSRGIGAAIARRFAGEGARVVVGYAHGAREAEQVAAAIGERALAVCADVRAEGAVPALFDAAERAFGGVDIVVCCAAHTHMRPEPIAEATDALYRDLFDVNVGGVLACLREAAKRLRPGGRVITFSSTGTATMHAGHGLYTASKAAVETLTRVFAREMVGRRVTVNCIAPGATATEAWLAGKAESTLQTIAKLSPLERLGTPDDIARAALFLASEESEWINGQVLRANGGFA